MRRKENKNRLVDFVKMIFIDPDYPEKEVDIEKSDKLELKELKESLDKINKMEAQFFVDATSAPKGGKSGGIVEKAEVDTEKAMKAVGEKEMPREQEGREI